MDKISRQGEERPHGPLGWANEFSAEQKQHVSAEDERVNEFSKLNVTDGSQGFESQVADSSADNWANAHHGYLNEQTTLKQNSEASRGLTDKVFRRKGYCIQRSHGPHGWANEFAAEQKQHVSVEDEWVNEFSKLNVTDWSEEFESQVADGTFGDGSADNWANAYDGYLNEQTTLKQNSEASRGLYVFSDMNTYVDHPNPLKEGQELFGKGLLSEAVLALGVSHTNVTSGSSQIPDQKIYSSIDMTNAGPREGGTTVVWARESSTTFLLAVDSRSTLLHKVNDSEDIRFIKSDEAKKFFYFEKCVVTLCGNGQRGNRMITYIKNQLNLQGKTGTMNHVKEIGVKFFIDNPLTQDENGSTITIGGWEPLSKKLTVYAFGDRFLKRTAYPEGCMPVRDKFYGCGSGSTLAVKKLKRFGDINFYSVMILVVDACIKDLCSGGTVEIFKFKGNGVIVQRSIPIVDILCEMDEEDFPYVFDEQFFFIFIHPKDQVILNFKEVYKFAQRYFPEEKLEEKKFGRWIQRTDFIIICLVKLDTLDQKTNLIDKLKGDVNLPFPGMFEFRSRSGETCKYLMAHADQDTLRLARHATCISELRPQI